MLWFVDAVCGGLERLQSFGELGCSAFCDLILCLLRNRVDWWFMVLV